MPVKEESPKGKRSIFASIFGTEGKETPPSTEAASKSESGGNRSWKQKKSQRDQLKEVDETRQKLLAMLGSAPGGELRSQTEEKLKTKLPSATRIGELSRDIPASPEPAPDPKVESAPEPNPDPVLLAKATGASEKSKLAPLPAPETESAPDPAPEEKPEPPAKTASDSPIGALGEVNILSDKEMEFDLENGTLVFMGNARMEGKTFDMRSNRIVVNLFEEREGIEQVVATGDVRIKIPAAGNRKACDAKCETATYDPRDGSLVLTGWPEVTSMGGRQVATTASTKVVLSGDGRMKIHGRNKTIIGGL